MAVIASDRRTLVVGLGKTGLSCVRHLTGLGREVSVADSRARPPGLEALKQQYPDVDVRTGEFDRDWFCTFNELVVSPGIAIAEPAIAAAAERGAHIRGDIDLFAEAAEAPILAITGSNGKTTVTTLVGELAAACGVNAVVGGNIGTPALELLEHRADVYVLELSSFQLETTHELNAEVATVLNVSDDHMDRYPSKMAYYQAKQRIFRGARQAVVNLDDALSTPMARDTLRFICYGFHRVNPETFSTREDEHGLWITWGLDNLLNTRDLKLAGLHNVSNVMAALGMGHAMGWPLDTMARAACDFRGLPHRCEPVDTVRGVEYINDSKGTNVGAAVAALDSLSPACDRIVLIAGGEGKGADFAPLARPVREHCRGVVLIGQDAGSIHASLGDDVPVVVAESMEEAVTRAAGLAREGDRVLLSPACASFDMFTGYEDRGERFRQAVEGL
ncbi:UDP-N-acetylmuramoyl-L-alanine--D-glutamate ligase [Marinobacter zhanjiangensis]|uniref:UDP-N-acetylmuramoylalanine--D-glutamate ligase n=1 Tax=Marinobacter zhanjiangensis TaxID=578215 RepID=A0ABQ3AYQ2_9GAMM|nr:UDP-N-acetylmuramoyl-L-alanine--D-glutamate ligase [Marinobacter zhanjiangensis]GGY68186.1 UDP-N-acetylmuramoylalanine--D-glutamate ligase [Marinobacter zhanjiangensis]